mmetsp:Transcript_33377/g.72973  ORF Transcript_33377/g.72973 Transcript_33377/m.72973 type:complete len:245 (-) Transcript_33377:122-856(-)
MLSDGSNPEGVDPDPPLNWTDKSSFTDVVLVSTKYSPPCAKIRAHLNYHGVPFTVISPKEYKASAPEDGYRKYPSLRVNGRWVNDSYIIVKHLTPALYKGSTFDEDWDKKITYGLQLAMEAEGFEDRNSWGTLVTYGGYPAWIATLFPCFLPLEKMAAGIRRRRAAKDEIYGPMRPASEYLLEFRKAVGEAPFLGGASSPGPIDVSMYGTVNCWRDLPYVRNLISQTDLQSWMVRMDSVVPADK